MTGMAFVGAGRESLRGDRPHQPGRLRAPDAVGHRHHHVLRPVQAQRGGDGGGDGRHPAATLGCSCSPCSSGGLVTKVGYAPVLRRPRSARPRGRRRCSGRWSATRRRRPLAAPAPEEPEASMTTIRNPILRGFNPDPSIVRVGDDYYVATSTFEWFPGVQIHHSRDLVHWRLLTRPLWRAPASSTCGATPTPAASGRPCLTHADGLFWLIYTDVKRYGRTTVGGASGASLRDFHNYLVTSPSHRRRVVRSRLPQQQRLRSLALPRRRRPQVPRQPALGPPARPATASRESCSRSTRSRSGGSWASG